jgi:hypothetical protein
MHSRRECCRALAALCLVSLSVGSFGEREGKVDLMVKSDSNQTNELPWPAPEGKHLTTIVSAFFLLKNTSKYGNAKAYYTEKVSDICSSGSGVKGSPVLCLRSVFLSPFQTHPRLRI